VDTRDFMVPFEALRRENERKNREFLEVFERVVREVVEREE
jgi:hypothetical protein